MARSKSQKIKDAYQAGKDRAYTGGSDPGKTTVFDVVCDVVEISVTGGLFRDKDQDSIDKARREGYKDGMKERKNPK